MRWALKTIIIIAILLGLGWWIGGLPGSVIAHSGRYTIETSTPAALLIVFVIALIFTALLRIIGGVRAAPGSYGAWRGGRRKALGDAATQRGIVALAAGDSVVAQVEAVRARKHLGDTPLVLLLSAEAARLAGRAEEAKAAFVKLTAHKEMAFLGHRGLLRHSIAEGDADAAHSHALMAQSSYSGGNYVQNKRLELAVSQGDWAALPLTNAPNQIAALATAAAQASTDKRKALAYAKHAMRANAGLAPAVVTLAQVLRSLSKPRAARNTLLSGWKTAPNPMIAAAFLQPFAAPIERAQAAATLAAARPGDAESELVLAKTALEAALTGEARRHADAAIAAGAVDGRAQNVLATLDDQPVIPAATAGWECDACHTTHVDWAPICPHCGKIGTLHWNLLTRAG